MQKENRSLDETGGTPWLSGILYMYFFFSKIIRGSKDCNKTEIRCTRKGKLQEEKELIDLIRQLGCGQAPELLAHYRI